RLKNIIEEYKKNTIKDRLEMIKIKRKLKKLVPDSDVIRDKAIEYWDKPSKLTKDAKDISIHGMEMAKHPIKLINDIPIVETVADPIWDEEKPDKKQAHRWDREKWDNLRGVKHNYKCNKY